MEDPPTHDPTSKSGYVILDLDVGHNPNKVCKQHLHYTSDFSCSMESTGINRDLNYGFRIPKTPDTQTERGCAEECLRRKLDDVPTIRGILFSDDEGCNCYKKLHELRHQKHYTVCRFLLEKSVNG